MAPKRTGKGKPGSKAEVVSQAPGQIIEGEVKDVTDANIDTQPLTQEEGGQTQAEAESGSTEAPAEEGAAEESAEVTGDGGDETSEEAPASEQPSPVQEAEGQPSEAVAPASTPEGGWPIQLPTGGTNSDGSPRFIQIFPDTPTRCMTCGATFYAKDAVDGICPAFDSVKRQACGGSLAPVGG